MLGKLAPEDKLPATLTLSMFAGYLAEREGAQVIESSKGFATYFINGQECYLRDIWVYPEYRKLGIATWLADKVVVKAKQAGCTLLTGSVCPTTAGSTDSLRVLLGYGMTLHSAQPNLIFFSKAI